MSEEKYKVGLTKEEYIESLEHQRNFLSADNLKLHEKIKLLEARANKVLALKDVTHVSELGQSDYDYIEGYNDCLKGVRFILKHSNG